MKKSLIKLLLAFLPPPLLLSDLPTSLCTPLNHAPKTSRNETWEKNPLFFFSHLSLFLVSPP